MSSTSSVVGDLLYVKAVTAFLLHSYGSYGVCIINNYGGTYIFICLEVFALALLVVTENFVVTRTMKYFSVCFFLLLNYLRQMSMFPLHG